MCVCLKLCLFLVNLGSGDFHLKFIELSFVVSLKICELLLLLIVQSELLVFLLLIMILELDLKSCLLLESTDKLRVNNNIGDIALLKLDSI